MLDSKERIKLENVKKHINEIKIEYLNFSHNIEKLKRKWLVFKVYLNILS